MIKITELQKFYRTEEVETVALNNLSIHVKEGEFVAVMGPSGCGKSTLLNMTAGLFQPSAGEVLYDGRRVDGVNLHTGYMTQNDHLLPWRTVAANIRIPLEIRGVPRREADDRIASLIGMVGLRGFERSYPSQLSGGMRKRTALARLLAYDPETLLLDEPFAALDAQLRLNMQVELLNLSRRLNKTMLFVTHDLDEAAALGDRCVVFSPRPGTIRTIIESPLPRDRNVLRLRHDPRYIDLTAQLWDLIIPTMTATHGDAA